MLLLAGDIGGTNSRLMLSQLTAHGQSTVAEKNYASADHEGLLEVVRTFLRQHEISSSIDAACFAIAGPVQAGTARVTNLPWVISGQQLAAILPAAKITLLNDLAAAAHGISVLQENDLLVVQQGREKPATSRPADAVVVAAGTGLGAAHRVWCDDHYRVFPSEAGHSGFAPESSEQTELLKWMQQQHSHVSLELLLSGKGLFTIYNFLRQSGVHVESTVIAKAMLDKNPSQVITGQALAGSDALCVKTLQLFVEIYGAAAGNIALQHYPVDELYLAGGIAPKIREKITGPRFIEAFNNKGLMSSNMKNITVKIVLQEKTGLLGALSLAAASLS